MTPGIPITDVQRSRIVQMRADGHTIAATAQALNLSWTTVWMIAPGRVGKVPNDRLREAFLESGVTASSVAQYLGWSSPRNGRQFPDTSRVRRTLGLLPTTSGNGCSELRGLIDWETGSLIAEAIGIAAWSVLDDHTGPVPRPDGKGYGVAA